MPSIFVTARLIAANKQARQNRTNALKGISEYSHTHEPGVVRYAICHPLNESDSTSIYVFEEYLTQSAFDAHMSSKPVQEDAIAYFGANPHLFGGAPTVCTTLTSSAFSRPESSTVRDPVIVFGSWRYEAGRREEALDVWKRVVMEEGKRELGVLAFGVYVDKEDGEAVKTIGVYESEKKWREVGREKDEGEGNGEVVALKSVGGYLAKERIKASL